MSELLEIAVSAHGGLDRWDSVTSIDVAASITGRPGSSRARVTGSKTLIAIDIVEITMRRPAANHV